MHWACHPRIAYSPLRNKALPFSDNTVVHDTNAVELRILKRIYDMVSAGFEVVPLWRTDDNEAKALRPDRTKVNGESICQAII